MCAFLDSMQVSTHSAQEFGFLQQLTNNNGNQEGLLGGFYLQISTWFISISATLRLSAQIDNPASPSLPAHQHLLSSLWKSIHTFE
ncbi:unnamed protein product [Pleuronectes platessa]|uniref:Uncharacterized protein n=1 Tax=Pleuronectes platessa TaxID=8262 RepID=A0A9N7YKS1_PLEPL|nr:unnamed protein product [Pleuronectes platessa]